VRNITKGKIGKFQEEGHGIKTWDKERVEY
jgi:hypothetical protein